MSDLSGAEKLYLEDVFGMDSGLVLHFTDRSFEQFFEDYGVDIHSARYQIYGTSKADKMRGFWVVEPNELVGRVLFDLLDYCEAVFSPEVLEHDSLVIKKSRAIATKLSAKSPGESYNNSSQSPIQEYKTIGDTRQLEQLWGPSPVRVFISHVSMSKSEAKKIKDALEVFGVASFVAHNDIEPSREWQSEIELAMSSMNFFIALLTEEFRSSDWTDQEVGFALARKVPILPVARGVTPYGFIAKFQALNWTRSNPFQVALKILEMAMESAELNSFAISAFIDAVSRAGSWAAGGNLCKLLKRIESFSPDQAELFVDAYNSNRQVYESWVCQDLVSSELSRLTENSYGVDVQGRLQLIESPD